MKKLFGFKYAYGDDAFFQRDTTVLIRIFIIIHEMVVVLRVGQKRIVFSKNILGT